MTTKDVAAVVAVAVATLAAAVETVTAAASGAVIANPAAVETAAGDKFQRPEEYTIPSGLSFYCLGQYLLTTKKKLSRKSTFLL